MTIWICVILILFLALAACLLLIGRRKTSIKLARYLKDLEDFENIVAHTNDALFVIDIVNGKILRVNNASSLLLFYSHEELLKKSYSDLLPREYLNKSAEIIAEVFENKGMVFSDIPHVTKQGEKILLKGNAELLILSSNTQKLVKERMMHLSELSSVPMLEFAGTGLELGSVCGKPFTVSVMIIQKTGKSKILSAAK